MYCPCSACGADMLYCKCLGEDKPYGALIIKPDPVDQPAHYARWPMQPIEFITINDKEGWYCRGNVIKYVMRYDAKNVLEDLYKARSYLDMLIRKEEGVDRFWEAPVAAERKANGK